MVERVGYLDNRYGAAVIANVEAAVMLLAAEATRAIQIVAAQPEGVPDYVALAVCGAVGGVQVT